MLTVTAVYKGGVLLPTTRLDLPENTRVEIRVLPQAVDPKDALMDDEQTLLALYAEFEQQDRQLAETGLAHYAQRRMQDD